MDMLKGRCAIGSFYLVGRFGAAPREVMGKDNSLHGVFSFCQHGAGKNQDCEYCD